MEILKGTQQELYEFLNEGKSYRHRQLDNVKALTNVILDAEKISVPMKRKRYKLGYRRNSWRRADLLQLQELHRQGYTKSRLGKMLNRTTGSIVNALYRIETGEYERILNK
jgi:hypothetical protein